MDVDTIEAGVDFVDVLQNAVRSCDVLVALIGRSWLNIKDETGKHRLDNPEDFVRVEIAAALSRNIRVIPVLVDGVPMPRSPELPGNLKPLARRNALEVNHQSFNADAYRLIEQLNLALKAAEDYRVLEARKLLEERERKEREAHEAKERKERENRALEEKARKDKEVLEKARKNRIVREKKETKEIERQQEIAERIKKVVSGRGKIPLFIGGGIVILFLLSYLFRETLVPILPVTPVETTTGLPLPSATTMEINTNNIAIASSTPTEFMATPTETYIASSSISVGSILISNIDGMRMVYVPAGEFKMGKIGGTSIPQQHILYLNAFWIDQTEVTNAMFTKFIEDTNYVTDIEQVGESYAYLGNSYSLISGANWEHPSGPNSNILSIMEHPVVQVSWNDARAYCEWANRRLPTEAEWEKAASWDEEKQLKNDYPWGNAFDGTILNFCDKNCLIDWSSNDKNVNDGFAETAPVGSYLAGASYYGALDMAGNVSEWVSSLYEDYPYDATDGREDMNSLNVRVLRGGSWSEDSVLTRSTYRSSFTPTDANNFIGIRCALDATP